MTPEPGNDLWFVENVESTWAKVEIFSRYWE